MKYLDTSAFVKYYGDPQHEKGAQNIHSLIERAKQGKELLITSVFTIGEAVSVFDRWVRLRAITKKEATLLTGRLLSDIAELTGSGGLIIEEVSSLSVLYSIILILTHHLPLNDSLHLLAALNRRHQIEAFISADVRQLQAAKKEGLSVWNPEDEK